MAVDPFVNIPIYDKQLGKTTEIASGGSLEINGVAMGLGVTITPAAGSGGSNICNVTFQVVDGAGNSLANVFDLSIWLSDASTGAGVTATTASGGISITTGTSMQVKIAAKALEALTDATGKVVLAITDTVKTHFFPVCEAPGTGLVVVGAQLTTANYG